MGGSVRASVRGAGGSGGGPGPAPVRENAGFSYLSADSGVAFFSSFSGGSPGSRSSSSQCSRRPRGGAVEPGGAVQKCDLSASCSRRTRLEPQQNMRADVIYHPVRRPPPSLNLSVKSVI